MKKCGCSKNFSCGCCEGIEILTPQATANRPGLSALRYRVGTHSTFFETMLARLSNSYLETSEIDAAGNPTGSKTYPLKNLNTRAADDPSIALLDASAMMLDVLTFYQERIINEGYLKTATERRSILELARLVGYTLRPGVAASVFLAYTMDDNSEPVEIPVGSRAQSVPAPVKSSTDAAAQSAPPPVELPQSFETSEKIEARKEWNDLKPRVARPQNITAVNAAFASTIYFKGTETNLKPNDPLLFVPEGQAAPLVFRKVKSVEPLFDEQKTRVTLQSSLDDAALKNVIQQVIERYQANFAAFCLNDKDESFSSASQLLTDAKTKIANTDTTREQVPQILLGKLKDIKSQSNQGGNTRMQKWITSLTNELQKILPALSVADVSNGNNAKTQSKGNGETNDATKGHFSTSAFRSLINLTAPLSLSPSKQPANSLLLDRGAAKIFDLDLSNDTLPQILTAFNKDIGTKAYQAWANATVTEPLPVKVYALRVTAPLFGNSAPSRISVGKDGTVTNIGDFPIVEVFGPNEPPIPGILNPVPNATGRTVIKNEEENIIYLDSGYDKITPNSWVVVDMRAADGLFENFTPQSDKLLITKTKDVSPSISRAEYGITGKTTRLNLGDSVWINFKEDVDLKTSAPSEFRLIRQTVVHAQSEQLELADEPITYDVCGDRIELGSLYNGLRSGRWIIVSGERTDIPNTSGVKASELAMLSGVEQIYDEDLPGDTIHSTLILAKKLAYTYKRDTVKIYGNVVKATHGETRNEVLGSGDAAQAMQAFTLKQPPLTYVSAPNASGIKNTLVVRVNDVEWKEAESLVELSPQDRNFVTKTDDEAKTTVIFGNGEQGARLPTGIENVKAVYRNGIGKPGNVKAEQISLLMTKPLGVREVINPLRASGGADKETGDQARRNVPIALMALDRLVSTRDYADFARTFAGIGKASAVRLLDGHRQVVHLTIAGADDIPIDVNSDLYNNLRRALSKYGDSFVPVQIAMRELLALVIVANVHILPDYLWESVEPKIRTALFDTFSFERRELGQSVFLSEVVSVIQAVKGVLYVDVDILDSISETEIKDEEKLKIKKVSWIDPEFKKARAAAKAVADAAIEAADKTATDAANGAAAKKMATAARSKAETFITEPEKTVADIVAKAAESAAKKDGAKADSVKAAIESRSLIFEENTLVGEYVRATLAHSDKIAKKLVPAQLAYLMPDVPDTLILSKIEEVKK